MKNCHLNQAEIDRWKVEQTKTATVSMQMAGVTLLRALKGCLFVWPRNDLSYSLSLSNDRTDDKRLRSISDPYEIFYGKKSSSKKRKRKIEDKFQHFPVSLTSKNVWIIRRRNVKTKQCLAFKSRKLLRIYTNNYVGSYGKSM